MIPTVKIRIASYENVLVDCPHCGREVIYNRVTDIGHGNPISGLEVVCLHPDCRLPFWIISDMANASFEMLLFDCDELLGRKHYMQCVLLVAQSYEIFFSLYLRVHLVYKPFARAPGARLEEVNGAIEALSQKTEKFAFDDMRTSFLNIAVAAPPADLASSATYVAKLVRGAKQPTQAELKRLDNRISAGLLKIKKTKIGTLRNSVVHKMAYRPTFTEAQGALKEAQGTLPQLGSFFDLHDDINWHRRKR